MPEEKKSEDAVAGICVMNWPEFEALCARMGLSLSDRVEKITLYISAMEPVRYVIDEYATDRGEKQ